MVAGGDKAHGGLRRQGSWLLEKGQGSWRKRQLSLFFLGLDFLF